MANSGYIQTNTTFGYVRLDWAIVSQDIASNTSSVNYALAIQRNTSISSTASKSYSININGVTVASGTTTIGGSGLKTIKSGTTTISHNADGTKTFNYSFSQQIDITYSGNWVGTVTGNGSGTLNTIARATQPSLNVAAQDIGKAIIINLPRASNNFTHTIRYGFGSLRETIATQVATSYTWTIPMNLANQIGNATSGVGLIWCDTYNGSTLIGTKEIAFTAKVPEDIKPYFTSITATEAVAGLAAQFGAYVQHKSKVSIVSNALGVYSSQIVSYRHEILGGAYLSKDFTSSFLSTSGSITIKSYCTDTRGRVGTATTTITVLPYEAPKIAVFNATRALSNGTESYDGTYLKSAFNFTISPLNNKNTKQYQIQYKLKTASTWTTLVNNTNLYNANSTYTSTAAILADTNSYDVRLYVADYFTAITANVDVGTAFTLMDFRNTGKGLGIGKVSEKDALEIAVPVEIDGQPIQGGAITVYSLGQQQITTANYTKVNFNNVLSQAGNNFTLNNNNVVCNKTGYVEISGMVSITGGTTGDNFYIFLFKETVTGTGSSLNISSITKRDDWTTIQATPVIVDVAKGDKIYIAILNNNARGTLSVGDNLAWMNKLTVKYVG